MSEVKFYNVTQAQYETAALNADLIEGALYYTTDTLRIYRAKSTTTSNVYGRPVILVNTAASPAVNFPETGDQNTIYIDIATAEKRIYANGSWITIDRPVVTSLTGSSTDDQVPTAKAVYDLILAQSVTATHAPVQDLTALAALSDMVDKQLIWVEDAVSIYAYDEQSTATAESPGVIAPTSGTGRWVKLSTSISYTAGTGMSISGQTLALLADAAEFEFDADTGALKIKAVAMSKVTNLSTELAGKMSVASGTTGHLVKLTAGGEVEDAGVSVGSNTLGNSTTAVPTERAVTSAINTALQWNTIGG